MGEEPKDVSYVVRAWVMLGARCCALCFASGHEQEYNTNK